MEYSGDLVITTRNGAERRKTWRSFRVGVGRGAHRLIVFLSPADVRGVAFLSRGHATRSAEQWLYLPSMGRERRLAEPDRGTRFAGTDFTFEDLQELDPALYHITSLPDVLVEDEPAARIRLVPLGRSAYTDEVLTVRRSDLVLLSRESRRRGDTAPSKELRLSSFAEINGRVAARRAEMIDRARGSRTVINLSDIRFDHPQPADRFTIQNLPRAASR
jgi:hypothetical protein